MSKPSDTRLAALEELAQLAGNLVSPHALARRTAQWQRMLLGKLTELLLNEDSRLTGAELRQLIGIDLCGPKENPPGADAKLPPAFGEIVRQIYGVNLQTDVRPTKPGANHQVSPATPNPARGR